MLPDGHDAQPDAEVPIEPSTPTASARLRAARDSLLTVPPPPARLPLLITTAIGALSMFAFYMLVIFPIELVLGRGSAPAPPATTTVTAVSLDAGADPLDAAPDAALDAAPDAGADASTGPTEPVWRVAALASDPNIDIVEQPVGKRPFLLALAAAGVKGSDSHRLMKAFAGLRDFDRARPKDTFTIARTKGKDAHLVAFEYATSVFDIWQARDPADVAPHTAPPSALEAKKLDLPVEQRHVSVGLMVGADLVDSLKKAGLDDDMVKMLDDALEGHAELADIRAGSRLRIIGVEDRVNGAFARYAELGAVEYSPPNARLPSVRVYRMKSSDGGVIAYYDSKGQQPYSGGWRKPVPLARLASRFNPRRMHPVLHVVMPHNGVDFAAPAGTPIYATAAGIVKHAGDGGPCGNMVQILHSNGLTSAYCHMSRFATGLHVGQHVEQRQLVGYVGQTGRATGPHLHFAIKRGEIFLDPLSLKMDAVRVLPAKDKDAFDLVKKEMDGALDAIALPAAPEGAGAAKDEKVDDTIFDEPP
jgi:murein DD-endopeptidase MepM/ murein hydrolase activator NlpD